MRLGKTGASKTGASPVSTMILGARRKGGRQRSLLVTLAALAIVGAVWAYVLVSRPPQETLDQRAHDVAVQLRCPVCQGETVADSSALISQQIRGAIRQQLQEGRSQQEIIRYFEARYGPQIVEAPPFEGFNLLAWLTPFGLLLVGALLLLFVLRDWRKAATVKLEDERVLPSDEGALELYRTQLERELAEEDPLFETEAH